MSRNDLLDLLRDAEPFLDPKRWAPGSEMRRVFERETGVSVKRASLRAMKLWIDRKDESIHARIVEALEAENV